MDNQTSDTDLQDSYEYLNSVIMDLPVGVAILEGSDFRYFKINKILAAMNGLSVEDHIGKTVAEVIPGAEEQIIPNLRKVFESGEPILNREFSVTLPKNLSKVIHLMDFHFPIKVDGKVKAVGAVVLDITKRKRTEEELKKKEEKYRSVTETAAEGINQIDMQGNFTFVNESFAKIFGYKKEELLGKKFSMLINPDRMTKSEENFKRVFEGENVQGESIAKHKDGYEFPVRFSSGPIKEGGKVVGLTGVMSDITKQKKEEEKLKKSEEGLKRAQSIAQMSSWEWDIVSNTSEFSEESYKLFDINPVGKRLSFEKFLESVHPEDRDIMQEAVNDSFKRKEKEYTTQFRLIRKDGTERIFHTRAEIKYDDKGKPIMMIGISLDITDRKKLEKEKKILTEKVAKLTKEIPLTNYEKKVFHGIVKYPQLNDRQLAEELNLKRSTVTSIKNKLLKQKFYSTQIIPNFAKLGCELMCILQTQASDYLLDIPETVYTLKTKKQSISILVGERFANIKNLADKIIDLSEVSQLTSPIIDFFPYEITQFNRFFDCESLLADYFEIYSEEHQEETDSSHITKNQLTTNEKMVLCALTKYPTLTDTEIARKTFLSRVTISNARKSLFNNGFYSVVNISKKFRIGFELVVFSSCRINCAKSSLPSTVVNIATNRRSTYISWYPNYTKYNEEQVSNKNNKNNQKDILIPTKEIISEKFDFSSLLKHIFKLDVDF